MDNRQPWGDLFQSADLGKLLLSQAEGLYVLGGCSPFACPSGELLILGGNGQRLLPGP